MNEYNELVAELSTIGPLSSKKKLERRREIHFILFKEGHVTFSELNDLIERIKKLQH